MRLARLAAPATLTPGLHPVTEQELRSPPRGRQSTCPRRVTAAALMLLAAGGCATAPPRRDVEVVTDCPRLAAAPAPPLPIAGPFRSPPPGMWSDGRRFGLGAPTTLNKHQLQPEGSLQDPPLDIYDPRTRDYVEEIKRRIVSSYSKAAADHPQSGSGVIVFMVRPDGRVGKVDVIRSTGSAVLGQDIATAIRLAAPFPPLPCKITEEAIPFPLSYEYVSRDSPRGFQP